MRRFLSSIVLASSTLLLTGCGSSQTKNSEKDNADTLTSIVAEEGFEYTELTKVPLPCSKERLYTAWKQIGTIEVSRKKTLDYRQHTPTLFISSDLDKDGNAEVLLRSEPPYAAIFTFVKDSLQLITFVDKLDMGLAITQDGIILRNSKGENGSSISEFIKLEKEHTPVSGATCEMFSIKDNVMVSNGIQYMLRADSGMVKVSKEEYEQIMPEHEGTFLEEIDGWEDFRKP